jgi:hypothetical protein
MTMPGTFRTIALLAGTLTRLTGLAQQRPMEPHPAQIDVAITYVTERAKVASVDCGCFWLQGGGMNAAVTVYRGLGVAANLTGGHASNIANGVELDKVSFMMGPRYTYRRTNWFGHGSGGSSVFAEGLIGGVHGFNTVVPTANGVVGAASSFVFQVGGGVEVPLRKGIGIRLIEADYVRSTLPNNGNNTQHDLRLAAGISFHFTN